MSKSWCGEVGRQRICDGVFYFVFERGFYGDDGCVGDSGGVVELG